MKKIIIMIIVFVIATGGIGLIVIGSQKPVQFETTEARIQDVTHEVSVTGKVVPATEVDLAFEVGGKIAVLPAVVGDYVQQGALLVSLETQELGAQLRQAQASAESARALLLQYQAGVKSQQVKLNEVIKGMRSEELVIFQIKVAHAEQGVKDAQSELISTQKKAEADINEAYQNALSALSQSVSIGLGALYTLTDIQFAYFLNNDTNSFVLAQAKADAIFLFLGESNGRQMAKEFMNSIENGARGKVIQAQRSQSHADIDEAISSMKTSLFAIQSALTSVAIENRVSVANTSNLNTEKANINAEIITASAKQQAIAVQKATNESAITSAQAQVTDATNALALAQSEFALKKAGATDEQVEAQRAQLSQSEATVKSQQALIKQADANIGSIQAQIAKRMIRSPITGVVTQVSAKRGEIVSASSPVVTVISDAQYEIEANIPEVDISFVSISDPVVMTLDAYGPDITFQGHVVTIDPAETAVDGVSTYMTKVQFEKDDNSIKSGMTVNIDILTDMREGVIILPQRALVQKDGKWFARVLTGKDKKGNPLYEERDILIGLRGSDGNTEITQGIAKGDTIISFIEEK